MCLYGFHLLNYSTFGCTFKIFEKLQPISLYWFAAQQQTSTSRQQKFDLFYPTFNPEFNELSLTF